MRTILKDYIEGSVFTNVAAFYPYSGHSPNLVKDSRLSRQGWFYDADPGQSSEYGTALYGRTVYGEARAPGLPISMEFDLLSGVSIDTLAIAGSNIDGNADIKIEWSLSGFDTPDGVATGVITGDCYYLFSSVPVMVRYLTITIDGGYSEGILKIGRIMAGLNYQLPGLGVTYDTALVSNSVSGLSDTRQVYGGPKVIWRRVSLTFAPQPDLYYVQTLFRELDIFRPTMWDFNESCLSELPLYGIIGSNESNQVYDEARLYSTRLTVEEVF